jgi:hypothetical protein
MISLPAQDKISHSNLASSSIFYLSNKQRILFWIFPHGPANPGISHSLFPWSPEEHHKQLSSDEPQYSY